jgi:hypothetical protein
MYFTQQLYAILTSNYCEILIKSITSSRMRMGLTGDWEWDPEVPPLEVEVDTDADI